MGALGFAKFVVVLFASFHQPSFASLGLDFEVLKPSFVEVGEKELQPVDYCCKEVSFQVALHGKEASPNFKASRDTRRSARH